jgi:hypothetical protein
MSVKLDRCGPTGPQGEKAEPLTDAPQSVLTRERTWTMACLHFPLHFRFAALLAATLLVVPATTASAQTTRFGAVVARNTSGRDVELRGVNYVDAIGLQKTLHGSWKLKNGFYGYLSLDDAKLVARELTLSLVDEDGSTDIRWIAQVLDSDGDFVLLIRSEDFAEHR